MTRRKRKQPRALWVVCPPATDAPTVVAWTTWAAADRYRRSYTALSLRVVRYVPAPVRR